MSLRQGTAGFSRLEIPHESIPSAAIPSFGCLVSVKMRARGFLFSLVLTEVWGLGRQSQVRTGTQNSDQMLRFCPPMRWSNTGKCCPERLWTLHPWEYSEFNWVWWPEQISDQVTSRNPSQPELFSELFCLIEVTCHLPDTKGLRWAKDIKKVNNFSYEIYENRSESQGKSICVRYKITNRDLSLPSAISQFSFLWFIRTVEKKKEIYLLEEDKFFSWCCLSEQNNLKSHELRPSHALFVLYLSEFLDHLITDILKS